MTSSLLAYNALVLLVYMSLWFMLAKARKRLDTVDVAWGLGFVTVAWSCVLQEPSARALFIALLVSVWGLRLANHIYQRAKNRGEDPRYEALSKKWRGNFWVRAYFSIFLLQGAMIWVVSLPVMAASGDTMPGRQWLMYVGGVVWLIGFVVESLADRQLEAYLRLADKPKVMDRGLWHYSRHPNYFGELTQWWGIGIIALEARNGVIGLSGPLVLSILIIFISGIPPIEKRRAKDPAYREYQQKTSPLIPLPPKKI